MDDEHEDYNNIQKQPDSVSPGFICNYHCTAF